MDRATMDYTTEERELVLMVRERPDMAARLMRTMRGADVPETVLDGLDAYRVVAPLLMGQPTERFVVILLGSGHRLLGTEVLTTGSDMATLVCPRLVFRAALAREGCSRIIVAHNHPSGDPEPSVDDIRTTKVLVTAGKAIGIPIVDHVIVGADRWVSLASRGEM